MLPSLDLLTIGSASKAAFDAAFFSFDFFTSRLDRAHLMLSFLKDRCVTIHREFQVAMDSLNTQRSTFESQIAQLQQFGMEQEEMQMLRNDENAWLSEHMNDVQSLTHSYQCVDDNTLESMFRVSLQRMSTVTQEEFLDDATVSMGLVSDLSLILSRMSYYHQRIRETRYALMCVERQLQTHKDDRSKLVAWWEARAKTA